MCLNIIFGDFHEMKILSFESYTQKVIYVTLFKNIIVTVLSLVPIDDNL